MGAIESYQFLSPNTKTVATIAMNARLKGNMKAYYKAEIELLSEHLTAMSNPQYRIRAAATIDELNGYLEEMRAVST